MEKIILKNNIPLIIKENEQTPRIALCLYMGFNRQEKIAGETSLIKALLFQGTNTKTGEELATILEENGIDCYVTSTQDYLCFKLQCLNEDFELALDILKDIIFNSTFEEFEKEKNKIKGEFLSDLDSPQTMAFDEFVKNIFLNHPYGNTRSKILKDIDNITKEYIKNCYKQILNNSKKNIVVVGDFSKNGGIENITKIIDNNFKDFSTTDFEQNFNSPVLNTKKVITKTKKDVAQAQIIQGWIFPTMTHADCPAIHVMNTILGSSGLSSRLFYELREKKGLAYDVRSCYDTLRQCGCLWLYIGTTSDIQIAIDGFKTEIDKLKKEFVTEEELIGAKNNILGKRQFFMERNIQQASFAGLYELMDVGYDYEQIYQEKIKKITKEDIKNVANKYFTENFVLFSLAPSAKIKL